MSYEGELQLFGRMLDQWSLGHLLAETSRALTAVPDMGLRRVLSADGADGETGATPLHQELRENVIYYVTDEFDCRYVCLRLPGTGAGAALVVGPYVVQEIDRGWVEGFVAGHAANEAWIPVLEEHYRHLPVMEDERLLFGAFQALGEQLWGAHQFTTERIIRGIPETWTLLSAGPDEKRQKDILDDTRMLEYRYEAENRLMQLVSQGRVQRAQLMLSGFRQSAMERRTDPVRDVKNYTIILNTIMRKAVEQGGVHPVYIDQVSAEFARRIERTSGWDAFTALWREMAQKYCLLVKKHTMKTYSHLVQQVITKIDFDLTADLSLKALAEQLNVNASYLSAHFKRETGHTVTAYVADRRMEQAMYLLSATRLPISAVGQHCGIQDDNYFTKLFKRHTGKTPRQFRQEQNRLPKQ